MAPIASRQSQPRRESGPPIKHMDVLCIQVLAHTRVPCGRLVTLMMINDAYGNRCRWGIL